MTIKTKVEKDLNVMTLTQALKVAGVITLTSSASLPNVVYLIFSLIIRHVFDIA